MKWMIASDIHGSALYCEQLLAAFWREGADRLLLLGDLLYHGPRNDLPAGYDPKAVIRLLSEIKERVLCVRGNCDGEVDQMVLPFPILSDYAVIALEDRLLYATHGHHYHAEALPPLMPRDIFLQGHTHVPTWKREGERLLLNPGSVSIPKENSPHSYMILENGVFYWKTLEGEVYHSCPLS